MKSNFKRNLLIGFGASMVILIISSTASFFSISNLLESANLVNHTNEIIIELNKVNTAVLDAETGQRGYLLTGKEEFLTPYLDSRRRAETGYANLVRLTLGSEVHQAGLSELNRLIKERFRFLDLSIDAVRSGTLIEAANLQKGRDIMNEMRIVIARMQEQENRLLADRTVNLNRFASYTPPLIISAAMIALFITVAFYARVRSDFEERTRLQSALEEKDRETSNRIDIIQGIANQISEGRYEIRVNDQQSDSLGKVAGSLNKMAESLEYSFRVLSDKEWTQTGLARLNDIMIGEKDVETLSGEVIDFLANYTGSQAGAVYLLDRNRLTYSGGFAYVAPQHRRELHINEGALGQCIASRKPIEINDIPEGNIMITFATGEAKPRQVLAIPLLDGLAIKGAIELASLNSFTKRERDFLMASAPNIAIAISTAQNRRRLQELLEETQAQSEELRMQHTELENLNSELEVQSEKLQASEEELKVQQEELKQANQELEERSRLLEERNQMISERNVEIQQKADQLAQTTKYKSEFLANMSHELRTPLNSILLLSRLMSENATQNLSPDQIEYARVIQSSGHGLLSLIDEILDLSKIEAGKMKLEFQSVPVKEIVDDMHSLFNPVARERQIEFRSLIADDVPVLIETDKMRLEQVIRNLLSNAMKFTAKGFVELRIEKAKEDTLRIIVQDTGIGIPKEKQAIVFEAFQQADGSTRRKFGGTGLGLSISRELVRLLGGGITLESEVDKGTLFTVVVPARKPQKRKDVEEIQETVAASGEDVVRPKPAAARKYISTHIPQNIPDDRNVVEPGDRTVLIIEDDTNFAKSLLDFTRQKGYKGIVAVRGDEGVKLAREFRPIGILLDIQLPVKSGWEVMEELKSMPETRHIPVHIMSSHEVKTESLMKGAVDFINKPFAFEQMQNVFQKIEYVLTHHPKKVLIVEENPKHARALAYFLETFDICLEIRSDVADAIDSLKQNQVDCVILDMGIPDQSAYDTLESVKKTPGLEHLPIIIFTGKSLSRAEELKIKQYADSIVVKTAHSYKRIIDEVSLFLHLMESNGDEKTGRPKVQSLGAMDEVLKGKKVLVADDDMRNVFSLTKALEKYEMTVIAAVDGRDALQKLNENPDTDIVLMDIMMPEMDGYETTAAIRRDSRFRLLPVIAVTAKAMMGDRIKCINAGASDYITKPVDIDQLLSLLRVWLYEKIS